MSDAQIGAVDGRATVVRWTIVWVAAQLALAVWGVLVQYAGIMLVHEPSQKPREAEVAHAIVFSAGLSVIAPLALAGLARRAGMARAAAVFGVLAGLSALANLVVVPLALQRLIP